MSKLWDINNCSKHFVDYCLVSFSAPHILMICHAFMSEWDPGKALIHLQWKHTCVSMSPSEQLNNAMKTQCNLIFTAISLFGVFHSVRNTWYYFFLVPPPVVPGKVSMLWKIMWNVSDWSLIDTHGISCNAPINGRHTQTVKLFSDLNNFFYCSHYIEEA